VVLGFDWSLVDFDKLKKLWIGRLKIRTEWKKLRELRRLSYASLPTERLELYAYFSGDLF